MFISGLGAPSKRRPTSCFLTAIDLSWLLMSEAPHGEVFRGSWQQWDML